MGLTRLSHRHWAESRTGRHSRRRLHIGKQERALERMRFVELYWFAVRTASHVHRRSRAYLSSRRSQHAV
jgi:hypothetical protein